jgi:mRNA interferase RelE/StbE
LKQFTVRLAPPAQRDLEGLEERPRLQLLQALKLLEKTPFRHAKIKKLKGIKPPHYRLQVGDYRAIYRMDKDVVVVLRIVHRRELERALKDLL